MNTITSTMKPYLFLLVSIIFFISVMWAYGPISAADSSSGGVGGIAMGQLCDAESPRSISVGRFSDDNGVSDSISFGDGAAPSNAAHALALILNGSGIVGAPGASTAGLRCRINGQNYIIPLT